MEKLNCPNCSKPVPDNANNCIYCGTKVRETPIRIETPEMIKEKAKTNKNYSFVLLSIGILGIIIMFAYRAWLGGPIYAISAFLGFLELRKAYEKTDSESLISFSFSSFKGGDLSLKIYAAMLIILPVILLITSYRWVIVDTQRQVDALFGNLYGLYF